jgi:hypothetical protein
MFENGQYDWNMFHLLTKLIKSVVVDGSTYVKFNVIYYNGMNLPLPPKL